MSEPLSRAELANLTAKIVAGYVSAHEVPTDQLADLIKAVANTIGRLDRGEDEKPEPVVLKPAVSIRKSVTPDYIVCLEDGKQLKMLKRHLKTVYGMTPDDYRAKWGLASDYPMVAPNYAASRSKLAREIGLGRRRTKSGS